MTQESQKHLPRYKIGYHSDEWGMGGRTPTGIPSPDGAWVRYEDAQAVATGYAAARLEIESLQARAQEMECVARWNQSRAIVEMRADLVASDKARRELELAVECHEKDLSTIAAAVPAKKYIDSKDWREGCTLERIEWLHSMYESSKSEVARLEAQLEAVGAGGVEPLRKRECLHQIVEPQPATAQEPMFWVRLTDSGGYEGPLYRSSIDDVRKKSGAWTPLYTAPQPPAVAPLEHDEDWLEQMYWEFDESRQKSGDERLRFKGFMRAYGTKCAHGMANLAQMEPCEDDEDESPRQIAAPQPPVNGLESLPAMAREIFCNYPTETQKEIDDVIDWFAAVIRVQMSDVQPPAVEQEPVCWEYRWKDTHPQTVTSGQWSEWKNVASMHRYSVDVAVQEIRGYISQGKPYELRALYAEPKPLWLPSDDTEGGAV